MFVVAWIAIYADICLKRDGLASGAMGAFGEIEQRHLVVTPLPPDQLTTGENMDIPPTNP